MKYPEQVLCRRLAADPAVARHIGFKMYPLVVPYSSDLPYAVYQRNSVNRESVLGVTPPGVAMVSTSLMILADSYAIVREIADACRKDLDHINVSSQGIKIHHVRIADESETIIQLEGGDLPPAWQVTFNLDIQWSEE